MSAAEKIASIVGAGIAGMSLAFHLARRGWRVRVYEQEYPGFSASGRSAGIIVTIFEEELLRLALESVNFYGTLPDAEGRITKRRAAYFNEKFECLDKLSRIHESLGLDFRYCLSEEDLGVPFETLGHPSAMIETFILDTGWAVNALQSALAGLGVEIANARVEARGGQLVAGGDPLKGVVVLAAGPWTPALLEGLGYSSVVRDRYQLYRCQIASVEGPTPRLVIEDDALDYYLVPVSPSRFNIGDGPNTPIQDPYEGFHYDLEDSYSVLERYAERVPSAWESRLVQAWSAPCITGSDGLPLIDEIDNGLIVFTGLNGAGMSLAPALARLLAESLDGGEWLLPPWSMISGKPRSSEVREPYYIQC